ncbi:MAG: hypothetical protein LKI34_00160 [Bifidobacterium tibiigranuli]|jgi:hypothetical protein|uniref:hypothetical protein n=1 Tax=Bifidobacterium tibiigranuli TaxID=2172043 RepID=UPI0026EF066E|nr:hypothetical protein [Bifidobacterium tibiigranuli]MCI1672625.1 hypothetical protein [Bifidobacterium tibiigranuli]MCI1712370.1 hypothetical protein [Bifidobacterium tibiigranuli]
MALTRGIPVDGIALAGEHGLPVVAILPKTFRNDLGIMEQAHTQEGLPQFTVQTLYTPSNGSKAELLNVTLAAAQQPDIPLLTPVRYEQLTCSLWQLPSGRSGLSFSAASVMPATPVRKTGGD